MEPLCKASLRVLDQLYAVVERLRSDDYCKPSSSLGGSTLGQHVRHTIEFFQCLEQGAGTGVVNYDRRSHDKQLEENAALALEVIGQIRRQVEATEQDRQLVLQTGYGHSEYEIQEMTTTYFRELAYNLEHAVHHMAIMRIGLSDVAPYVDLPFDFGIAASTIRHRRKEAEPAACENQEFNSSFR